MRDNGLELTASAVGSSGSTHPRSDLLDEGKGNDLRHGLRSPQRRTLFIRRFREVCAAP